MCRDEATSTLAGFHAGPLSWSNWNQRYITEKSSTDGKFIVCIANICLKHGTLKELATAVLETVAIRAKRCLLSRDHFFESCE